MRADRLIQALLLLMQGRARITAAELAAELEVSVPTARRDLEALAMAGVPIYPTRGRGGGWQLIGGARTDLTGLTETEVTALLAGLTQSLGAGPDRVAALRKLVRAVPAPFREGAQRIAEATVRDVPWGESSAPDDPAKVAVLQRAIARRIRVRFDYDGSRVRRRPNSCRSSWAAAVHAGTCSARRRSAGRMPPTRADCAPTASTVSRRSNRSTYPDCRRPTSTPPRRGRAWSSGWRGCAALSVPSWRSTRGRCGRCATASGCRPACSTTARAPRRRAGCGWR
ncbi:HTH domain-containing protein [Microbacterium neungamense]|nr:HTH domain-containing protein [Microbacterium neungamense]